MKPFDPTWEWQLTALRSMQRLHFRPNRYRSKTHLLGGARYYHHGTHHAAPGRAAGR